MTASPGTIRGRVYYDAQCRFCVGGVRRWGGLFARRGFVWRPLQSPEAPARLGMAPAALRGEMKLQLADGTVRGGADAWATLCLSVWWLAWLGALLRLPGIRTLAAAAYRWVARHRHCLGGGCEIEATVTAPPRHGAFLELP
ncbi:MAG: thiol-disulfide oxidoreductase DCC family protein [Limisphaerales bacterium]